MKEREHYYHILDVKVLKIGQRIASCLDMEDIMTNSDGPDWWTGTIKEILNNSDSDYMDVVVGRDDHDSNGRWTISLDDDTIKYVKLYCKEWDD